ncbi:hypothetical protein RUM43_004699 [Polyplax serrata]|uniref:Uncharacterized protein n=1 Tax=Polyplax serrata TaxID=468196 RepID=A0AAN8XNK6_POLSC
MCGKGPESKNEEIKRENQYEKKSSSEEYQKENEKETVRNGKKLKDKISFLWDEPKEKKPKEKEASKVVQTADRSVEKRDPSDLYDSTE